MVEMHPAYIGEFTHASEQTGTYSPAVLVENSLFVPVAHGDQAATEVMHQTYTDSLGTFYTVDERMDCFATEDASAFASPYEGKDGNGVHWLASYPGLRSGTSKVEHVTRNDALNHTRKNGALEEFMQIYTANECTTAGSLGLARLDESEDDYVVDWLASDPGFLPDAGKVEKNEVTVTTERHPNWPSTWVRSSGPSLFSSTEDIVEENSTQMELAAQILGLSCVEISLQLKNIAVPREKAIDRALGMLGYSNEQAASAALGQSSVKVSRYYPKSVLGMQDDAIHKAWKTLCELKPLKHKADSKALERDGLEFSPNNHAYVTEEKEESIDKAWRMLCEFQKEAAPKVYENDSATVLGYEHNISTQRQQPAHDKAWKTLCKFEEQVETKALEQDGVEFFLPHNAYLQNPQEDNIDKAWRMLLEYHKNAAPNAWGRDGANIFRHETKNAPGMQDDAIDKAWKKLCELEHVAASKALEQGGLHYSLHQPEIFPEEQEAAFDKAWRKLCQARESTAPKI